VRNTNFGQMWSAGCGGFFFVETEFCDQFILTVTGGGVMETKICRVNFPLFCFEKSYFYI